MTVDDALWAPAHLLLLIGLPPLLLGLINRVKARVAGRNGPPLLQVYYDLARLLRKQAVISTTTTWVFRLGPVAAVATTLAAGLFVPFGGSPAPLHFHGDVLLVVYLLALGRLATVLSALDTGSAFEGMGASREVAFAVLAEPALILGLAALWQASGGTDLSLTALLGHAALGWSQSAGAMTLVLAAWMIVLLVENCRIPFDDPNTHLELTMIHEVMVLDHSGPAFGLITWGAAMKLQVVGCLVVALCCPATGNRAADLVVGLCGLFLLAMSIGLIESAMARLRLLRVPLLLVSACLLAAFGVIQIAR